MATVWVNETQYINVPAISNKYTKYLGISQLYDSGKTFAWNYAFVYAYPLATPSFVTGTATPITTSFNIINNYTSLSVGTYYFNATAYDFMGYSNATETRNVTIVSEPNITFVAPILVNNTALPISSIIYLNASATTFNGSILANEFGIEIYKIIGNELIDACYNGGGPSIYCNESVSGNTTTLYMTSPFIGIGDYYYNASVLDMINQTAYTGLYNFSIFAFYSMVGGAINWTWQIVDAGEIIMSGSPINWTWRVFAAGSGRQIPNGTPTNWTWVNE